MHNNFLDSIDETWTLFLDRDGVLNHEISGDYVRNIEQLVLYENIKETIAIFNKKFKHIIIVTNQRCVGKGIIDEDQLLTIHKHLLNEINTDGKGIDKIYFAPNLENDAHYRKPQIGMALQAQRDFISIDFSKSIMVGNSPSDMGFGYNAGMKNVFVTTTKTTENIPYIDLDFATLGDFAKAIEAV
jgi:D-glycero-D-manno-heptose 1,7-bisphosphate phosphatase